MKYEIINPSDKCYISSDNEKVACLCNLLLGRGMYALEREDGSTADYIHFGYSKTQLDKDYEGDFDKFIENHKEEVIKCFESFEYPGERTSLNNIGARAQAWAKSFKEGQNI